MFISLALEVGLNIKMDKIFIWSVISGLFMCSLALFCLTVDVIKNK